MQAVNWDGARDRTIALHARRGSGGSGQALPDVLSETQVRQAEDQFGVEFPEDYRQYLLRVNWGGRVRTLQFNGSRWGGARHGDHEKLHVAFPDHDIALAASEDAWDSQPQRVDYTSDAVYQADHDAWQEAAYAIEAARTTGAVFLSDDGCGFSTLLAVSGPMRGTMWFDGRATCDRLNPLMNDHGEPATFAEWYLDWLNREEMLTTLELRRAASARWHAGTDPSGCAGSTRKPSVLALSGRKPLNPEDHHLRLDYWTGWSFESRDAPVKTARATVVPVAVASVSPAVRSRCSRARSVRANATGEAAQAATAAASQCRCRIQNQRAKTVTTGAAIGGVG